MTLRRFSSALAVVAIVAVGAVAVPSSASAAAYTPPVTPVEVLPDTPPEWEAAMTTISNDELALRRAQIQMGSMSAVQRAKFAANGALSRLSPVGRGNTVVLAGTAGFALGAGTMRLVYAATGVDWDQTMCNLPEVVREGYAMISFGVGASTCPQPVVHPNSDQDVQFGDLVLGGATTLSYKGWFKNGVGNRIDCYGLSPVQVPTSGRSDVTLRSSGGVVYGGGGYSGSQISGCPAGSYFSWEAPPLSWVSSTAGVVATMSEQTADPSRQYRVATRAPGASGYTGRCMPVSAKDTEGFPLSALGASCGGVTVDPTAPPEAIGIQELNPKTGAWDTVLDSPLPLEQRQQMEAYPDCYDGSQTCTLTLRAAQGTTTTACLTAGSGACAGWWADTVQGTQTTTATGVKYDCSYGPYPVDLARCSVYREAFEVGTKAGTITDPGGEPIPRGNSSTSPNTIDPGAAVGGTGGSCMDTWMDDLNPIDWVLTPVKCALQWAFVPRPAAVDDALGGLREKWEGSVGGSISAFLGGIGTALAAPGAGCAGLPFHLQGPGWTFNTVLFQACDEPMAGVAATVNGILTAVIIFGGGLALTRYIGAIFGYIPFGGGPLTHDVGSSGVKFK